MEIPQIIQKLRGDRTREQFAKDIGTSRQTVTWWETGRFVPSREWLEKLNISVTYNSLKG